jgi:uncharacterized protein YdcH (DUF465 family)
MPHSQHELAEAFPGAEARILSLKARDPKFAQLVSSYDEVNKLVLRIENEEEVADDFFLEDRKKVRLKLLDEISVVLKTA